MTFLGEYFCIFFTPCGSPSVLYSRSLSDWLYTLFAGNGAKLSGKLLLNARGTKVNMWCYTSSWCHA